MTKEEAIMEYIIPALKCTWNDKKVDEVFKALSLGMQPCESTHCRVLKAIVRIIVSTAKSRGM